jgi:hypothetical protein
VGIVGMPMNFVATAGVHEQAGTLFDLPVTVRFTPTSYRFIYGDGTSRDSPRAAGPGPRSDARSSAPPTRATPTPRAAPTRQRRPCATRRRRTSATAGSTYPASSISRRRDDAADRRRQDRARRQDLSRESTRARLLTPRRRTAVTG